MAKNPELDRISQMLGAVEVKLYVLYNSGELDNSDCVEVVEHLNGIRQILEQ